MPRILKNLRIDEVSCVLKAASPGARVLIRKADDDLPSYLFDDIMLRKADEPGPDDDIQPPNSATDADKAPLPAKLEQMVDAMVLAARQVAAHYLLHSPHGRKLYDHLSKTMESKPMLDIMKVIAITEQGLMAQVPKVNGETYAKSFSSKYENDQGFREQWRDLTDAKHFAALAKGTATLTPTSTEVGKTLVADDSMKAVRLLREMAEAQGRTFEDVFTDPANKALAGNTYTGAHRPASSTANFAPGE
jgi:hypothetical protein